MGLVTGADGGVANANGEEAIRTSGAGITENGLGGDAAAEAGNGWPVGCDTLAKGEAAGGVMGMTGGASTGVEGKKGERAFTESSAAKGDPAWAAAAGAQGEPAAAAKG